MLRCRYRLTDDDKGVISRASVAASHEITELIKIIARLSAGKDAEIPDGMVLRTDGHLSPDPGTTSL